MTPSQVILDSLSSENHWKLLDMSIEGLTEDEKNDNNNNKKLTTVIPMKITDFYSPAVQVIKSFIFRKNNVTDVFCSLFFSPSKSRFFFVDGLIFFNFIFESRSITFRGNVNSFTLRLTRLLSNYETSANK